jgi:hypothetical protein
MPLNIDSCKDIAITATPLRHYARAIFIDDTPISHYAITPRHTA